MFQALKRFAESFRVTSKGVLLVTLIYSLSPLACARAGQDRSKTAPTDQAQQRLSIPSQHDDSGSSDRPVPQKRDWRYQLRPGDSFSLRFPYTPEFNQQEVAVQPDGYVTLQGLGECAGSGQNLLP